MDKIYVEFFRKLIENSDNLFEHVNSLYAGNEYSDDDLTHIFGVLKKEGLISCQCYDNKFLVQKITFKGKHFFDDDTDNRDTSATTVMKEIVQTKKPKIFISHSSKDVNYVTQIVHLLDGMGLNQTQVFCSSLPGYGIPIDTNIFDCLRDQFLEYALHVIFVHSDNYYKSAVSLNEMGAAWALKSSVTSILLPGFGFEKMAGVVNSQTTAIKLDNQDLELQHNLNQLYNKIVSEFGITKKSDIIWEQKRNTFIEHVRQVIFEKAVENFKLSEDAKKFLKNAEEDPSGRILKTSDLSRGTIIQVGSAIINNSFTQRESVRWIAALDELLKIGYVAQDDKNGQVFRMTHAGYKFMEELND